MVVLGGFSSLEKRKLITISQQRMVKVECRQRRRIP
jgi:hypothetical protein